jgi:hypothetical protein
MVGQRGARCRAVTVFSWIGVAAVIGVQVAIYLGSTLARTDLDCMPDIFVQITRKN